MSTKEKICISCNQILLDNAENITCNLCNNSFHYAPCSSLSEILWQAMSTKAKSEWKCSNCKEKIPTTRARSRADDEDSRDANAKKFKKDATAAQAKNEANNLQNEKAMQSEIKEIKNMLKEMLKNNSVAAQETVKLNESIELLNKKIDSLIEEGKAKDKRIDLLEEKINLLEQYNLRKNLVITNASTAKDPIETILEISQAVNASMEREDIKSAFRTKDKKKLVVKFKSREKKLILLKKSKENNSSLQNMKESHSTNNRQGNKVYVNDELTASNRKLLFLTKSKARERNWRYVWVKDGRILVKKEESSRPIYIGKTSDINDIN